ncbi:beta-galactosidase [Deinococcus aetherius]|uniref:Beta-galactosidase n=1 Tax=Deinococcus aetherius TaxID=200252 RepID=A0ABN6RBL3_9DEIO|nr:beta-galactosidase [Deinococcus aetherius]BDP40730.1 beta-galactosidase [Deinococcus aetherius]
MTPPDAASPHHLLLGSCDYPEHVPRDCWETYARRQRELGLTFVRLAEFAWSRLEPRPGEFDWAWLDEAVEAYHREGLRVVLCTPTATPPAWLIRTHPEILPVDEEGRVREFGSRRHYDFASPVYREHSRRITRAMAERYGQHPAVVGWQTDNEFACHGTGRSYGGASAAAFPGWLRERYGTLDALNEAWGNVFWSMEYGDWGQIKPPNLTVTEANPAHILDFSRFASDQIASFQREQVDLLRELSPGRFVTHNFMIFESGFDHYEVARGLDFATWDNYPTGMLEFFAQGIVGEEDRNHFARTGHPDLVGWNHDVYRGLLRGAGRLGREGEGTPNGFWVMEQQCGQVNWAPFNPLPADGAVALWTAQAWAHGADVVSYFRWRAATMAQEVLHSGLLRHDETPDRGYAEVAALNQARFPLGEVPARVALLHDYESLWLLGAQPHSASLSYWAQTVTYYRALRSLGVDVDILHPDADLGGYAVVVAPAITLATEERAVRWATAVEGGARLVCGPRTGFRTPSGQAWAQGQPGPLAELLGVRLLQFDSLRSGLTQKVAGPEGDFQAHAWAESYRLAGAEATHTYVGGPQGGLPAVTRQGRATVIGAHSDALIRAVLRDVLAEAGVETVDLPDGVRLSRRAGVTLVQNWNPEAVTWEGRTLAPVSFEVVEESTPAGDDPRPARLG